MGPFIKAPPGLWKKKGNTHPLLDQEPLKDPLAVRMVPQEHIRPRAASEPTLQREQQHAPAQADGSTTPLGNLDKAKRAYTWQVRPPDTLPCRRSGISAVWGCCIQVTEADVTEALETVRELLVSGTWVVGYLAGN